MSFIEGMPDWAWYIIILQGLTLYQIYRVHKWADLNYRRIMVQLGAEITPPKPEDFTRLP